MLTRRSSAIGAGQALGKYDYAILPINDGDMDPRGDSYRYFSMPRGPISVYNYNGAYTKTHRQLPFQIIMWDTHSRKKKENDNSL